MTKSGEHRRAGKDVGSHRHGGPRRGAGRPIVNLRNLDISDIGIEFSVPVRYRATGLDIEKCSACGCIWWEPFTVTATTAEEQPEPDENGFYFHVLAAVKMPGRAERHISSCAIGGKDALD